MTATKTVSINHISLTNVRSFAQLKLDLTPGITVFVGANGVGKTNLLEAIATLLSGSSPRTSSELKLIREGAQSALIKGEISTGVNRYQRSVLIAHGRGKRLQHNENTMRSVDAYNQDTPAGVFLPERLLAMRGAPARRRALIDQLTQRLFPQSQPDFRSYQRAIQQRNNLLRRIKSGYRVGAEELKPWNELVIQHGKNVRSARRETLKLLDPLFAQQFMELTGLKEAAFTLKPRGSDDIGAELDANYALDMRRGSTTTGPHLDEIVPTQSGRDLREFGSTGEQRASLLAFTFAAAELVTAKTGIVPTLFLDEPWSELDAERRQKLSERLSHAHQVFCTTTEPPRSLTKLLNHKTPIQFFKITLGSATECFPTTTQA